MNFNVSDSAAKIRNMNHFNYNPELKSFIEDYMESKPNLEIIKITDPQSIQDIERVVNRNDEAKNSIPAKRQRTQDKLKQFPTNPSRLLSALSGRRLNQVTLNRISSASTTNHNAKRN